MAKPQKLAAVLTAGAMLGLFIATGPALLANAAPSSVIIKSADLLETDDSTDDADESDSMVKLEKPSPSEKRESEKLRRELRKKFGSHDNLTVPPVFIHPEDQDDELDEDESDDDSAAIVPKKKPTVSPSPAATATATPEPSVTATTSSLKGGSIIPNPSSVTTGQQASVSEPTQSINQPQQQTGQTSADTVVSPTQANLIDLQQVEISRQSPADKFIEAATISLGAMGVGAIALGAVTVIRGSRGSKQPKSEYLYSSGE